MAEACSGMAWAEGEWFDCVSGVMEQGSVGGLGVLECLSALKLEGCLWMLWLNVMREVG